MRSKKLVCLLLIMAVCLTCLSDWHTTSAHAASVPVLIKDINTTIKDNSNIRNMIAAGSTLYFTAFDRAHGNELWKHDASGTAMVKDISPGTDSSVWSGGNFITYWKGSVYFSAQGPNGYSLWKSSGTAATTLEVSHKADPADIVVFNNNLFFTNNTSGLWKSDGTDGGTVAVNGAISSVDNLTVAGSYLYFTVDGDLWRSDGTSGGTISLAAGVDAGMLTAVGNTLLFKGYDATHGYELWRSNGSPAGTAIVSDIYAGTTNSDLNYLTNVGGTLYFSARSGVDGESLYKCSTSGTPEIVKTFSAFPTRITNVNGVIYFEVADDLWKSDGTNGGTQSVKADIYPDRMININGTLYFNGWDSVHRYELWKSDGSTSGTLMIKDINPGTAYGDPNYLTNVNGVLFFTATEPATGKQLWRSDGSEDGTVMVMNISPGSVDSSPVNLANIGGTLLFGADDDTHGVELWQTNGTAAGTSMVQDIKANTGNSNPKQIILCNGTTYFTVNDAEIWKRVGTGAAELVKAGMSPDKLACANGTLFFEGYDSNNNELWKSDGTNGGTVMVKNINPTGGSSINSLTSFNNLLYFTANDGTGVKLWRSDGTGDGTLVVTNDIKDVKSLTLVSSRLFFVGDLYTGTTLANNDTLWVIDGTGTVTQLVNAVWPSNLVAVGDTLFFSGEASGFGYELWKSNGTLAGTVMAKDVRTGTGSSNPDNLINVNGTLYFTVQNSSSDPDTMEIWKSDGSSDGTVLVKSLEAPYASDISKFTSVHGLLAFVFNDRIHGEELWTCDGTDAGTKMVKDIYPDLSGFGSSPENLKMAVAGTDVQNEALFFSAIDKIYGRELYILDFTPPESHIASKPYTPYRQPVSISFVGTASDSMPGAGVTLVQVSTNNGATWNSATDTSGNGTWSSWQYVWQSPPEGTHTVRSRAIDLATNVQSTSSSTTVRVSVPHTLIIDLAGTGSGTVKFGSSVYNTDHSLTVYTFDDILLVPTRNTYSLFNGWSGVCGGTGNCSYTVPTVASGGSSHTATATFTYDWPHAVKVMPNNTFYQKISDAYKADSTTASGATIRAWGIYFADTLLFNLGKHVALMGGDNEAHTDNSAGMTTVPGPVTIESGEVTVDRMTIK